MYLRLSTLDELPADEPYKCHIMIATPHAEPNAEGWPGKLSEIEGEILKFWNQFEPGIECAGVEVLGTDHITLADIEPYQRFDADWVSFEDETPIIPPALRI